MATGLVRSRRYPLVLAEDRGKARDEQTVFYLRPISAALRAEFDDSMRSSAAGNGEAAAAEGFGKWSNRILREALVGWENLRDEGGAPIAFETEPGSGCSEKALDCLLATHRYEIAGAALSGSYLGESEKKSMP